LFKKGVIFIAVALVLVLLPKQALAVCPVCTVAIGAGVGLSRWFGISDTISGLWIGGFILSSGIWISNWLHKRHVKIYHYRWQTLIIVLLFYALTFWSLSLTKITGHPFNKIFGIDKLVLGSIIGSIVFLIAVWMDKYLRKINEGKVKFYYQKVILPVGMLLVTSIFFYLIRI
jgi:hypothetical protein